jgi:hypothetical protein
LYLPPGTSTSFLQATGHAWQVGLSASMVSATRSPLMSSAWSKLVICAFFTQLTHQVHEDVGTELMKPPGLRLGGRRLSKPFERSLVGLAESGFVDRFGHVRAVAENDHGLEPLAAHDG